MTNSVSPAPTSRTSNTEQEQEQEHQHTDTQQGQSTQLININITPQPTPSTSTSTSTSSGLMYHGTTIRKTQSQPRSTTPPPPLRRESESTRKCWICYDDDRDDHLNHPSSDPNINPKKWVKPCRCSLVAHESCLLTWITTYQLTHPTPPSISSPLLTPVKCPQCSATYEISQPPYPLLSLIHRLRKPYHTAISWSALGSVILAIGVSASSYGIWASRCFLGPVRWNSWIANPQHAGGLNFLKFFQLSLIGPILILSRTKQLDSVLPFLPISLIFSSLTPLSLDGDLDRFHDATNALKFEHIFPPEPGLTLCLIPWMRIGWGVIWKRISNFVLDREYTGMNYPYPLGLGLGARVPAIAEAHQNQQPDPMAADNNNPDLDQPGDEDDPNERPAAEVVLDYSSLRTILRIAMEALIWPGAASVVGSLLLLLSKNRTWLRNLLGLKPSFHPSFITHASTGTSTGSRFLNTLKSSISQLLYKATRIEFFCPSSKNNYPPPRGVPDQFKILGSYDWDGYEDPVWWRNTLGGSLLVVVKDLLCLVEKVLRVRKLKYRRILDVDQIPPINHPTTPPAAITTVEL